MDSILPLLSSRPACHGRAGMRLSTPSSFRRRPESTPTGMQVVERRLEQAAEEGEVEMLDGLWFLPLRANTSAVIPALREWIV